MEKTAKKEEKIDLVVQYLVWIETNEDCVKAKLYMESESCYFQLEKFSRDDSGQASSDQLERPRSNSGIFSGPVISSQSGSWDHLSENIVSGKDFFNQLIDYFRSNDSYLQENICTFHHIVKNAVKK